VADTINHTKFGNDRSREDKVTKGRILAYSIGITCRYHVMTVFLLCAYTNMKSLLIVVFALKKL